STCPAHIAPPPNLVRLVLSAETKMRPELERSRAVEDNEDLLLGAVAVRRIEELPRRHLEQLKPGLVGARRPAQVADRARDGGPVPGRRLDVRDIHDSLRAARERFHGGGADRDLTGPRVVVRASLEDPGRT